ncbi:hypothetical protein DL93DRAFT_2162529 [Clavulina sp. PMI_390]|nr:hypothetical protein DL93DRAFT_2162529 [Clavulina sp. PMI_390]
MPSQQSTRDAVFETRSGLPWDAVALLDDVPLPTSYSDYVDYTPYNSSGGSPLCSERLAALFMLSPYTWSLAYYSAYSQVESSSWSSSSPSMSGAYATDLSIFAIPCLLHDSEENDDTGSEGSVITPPPFHHPLPELSESTSDSIAPSHSDNYCSEGGSSYIPQNHATHDGPRWNEVLDSVLGPPPDNTCFQLNQSPPPPTSPSSHSLPPLFQNTRSLMTYPPSEEPFNLSIYDTFCSLDLLQGSMALEAVRMGERGVYVDQIVRAVDRTREIFETLPLELSGLRVLEPEMDAALLLVVAGALEPSLSNPAMIKATQQASYLIEIAYLPAEERTAARHPDLYRLADFAWFRANVVRGWIRGLGDFDAPKRRQTFTENTDYAN